MTVYNPSHRYGHPHGCANGGPDVASYVDCPCLELPKLRCNTGEYPRVQVPIIFLKAITRTQRVFRHRYPPPAGDTTGYLCARVPTGESGYHYQDPWYPWYPLVRVRSRTPVATILATLALFSMPLYQYIMILLN